MTKFVNRKIIEKNLVEQNLWMIFQFLKVHKIVPESLFFEDIGESDELRVLTLEQLYWLQKPKISHCGTKFRPIYVGPLCVTFTLFLVQVFLWINVNARISNECSGIEHALKTFVITPLLFTFIRRRKLH